MCTLIGYMTAVDTEETYERRIQVHPTRSIAAKSRIGGLPVVFSINDPNTLGDLVNKWLESGAPLIEDDTEVPESEGVAPTLTVKLDEKSTNEGLEL